MRILPSLSARTPSIISFELIPLISPTVPLSTLREIAASHSITIPPEDEQDYHVLLNSLDAMVNQLKALPEYEDPRLKPKDDTLGSKGVREYWKIDPQQNAFNAWSHRVISSQSAAGEAETFLTHDSATLFPHHHPQDDSLANPLQSRITCLYQASR